MARFANDSIERDDTAGAGTRDATSWLQRAFVGRRLGAGRATFGLLLSVLVLTVDATVHQLRGEASLQPATVPLVLGVALIAASHLFAAEHARPRAAAQVVGSLVLLAGAGLVLVELAT